MVSNERVLEAYYDVFTQEGNLIPDCERGAQLTLIFQCTKKWGSEKNFGDLGKVIMNVDTIQQHVGELINLQN